jgi:DNA repair exonuclease SbcCD ATPase subunit
MVIKLIKLTMLNFKGVLGERTIEFSPTLTQVLGANKTGKTTIADAFRWCLFGENSEGSKQFGVRTRNAEKQVIPNLPHEVTVWLDVDGSQVELKRCLMEKYTKVRNSEERTLSLPTAYYVNGQKYTESDYNAYIESLCHKSLFLCITNPNYFPRLKANEQRALLSKMVQVPSMEEVAQGNETFVELLKEMSNSSLEDYLKHIGYLIAQVKEELEKIPVRIEEQTNDLAKLNEQDTDWQRIEGDIKAREQAIERIDEQLADKSKVVDEEQAKRRSVRNSINQLKAKAQELQEQHRTEYRNEAYACQRKVGDIQAAIASLEHKTELEQHNVQYAQQGLEQVEQDIEDFRQRWAATDCEEFVIDSSRLVCPTCHRELEQEDQAHEIAEMEAAFNKAHAKRIERLEQEAEEIKARKAMHGKSADSSKEKIEQYKAEVASKRMELEAAQAIAVISVEQRINGDAQIAELNKQVQQLTEQLEQPVTELESSTSTSIANLKEDKAQMQAVRDALLVKLAVRTTIANKQKRIEELQKQEQTLNAQLSQYEGKEDAAKEFQLANINALEERVNKLFEVVSFTMFDRKLNGSVTPICECCIGGVPYSDLNTADKVNAGIDIINAICRYNNMYVPCFIDGVESINNPLPMLSQCIQLIVSRDKTIQIIK